MKITVSAKEFQTFISAISNVFRGGASLKVHKEYIECITFSEDSASIMSCAKIHILNENEINLSANEEFVINVPDLQKFSRLLDMNDEETFTFEIKGNYVYFKNSKVKGAKFVLDDLPAQKIHKHVTSKWFSSFTPKFETDLTKNQIKEILHLSSFADGSNKVYFYQDGPNLIAELNDRTIDNIDNVSIIVSDSGTGTIKDKVIIAVDSLSSLILTTPSIKFAVVEVGNKIRSMEAILFTLESNGVLIKYLFNSKVR
jgi:hypothetical protein